MRAAESPLSASLLLGGIFGECVGAPGAERLLDISFCGAGGGCSGLSSMLSGKAVAGKSAAVGSSKGGIKVSTSGGGVSL